MYLSLMGITGGINLAQQALEEVTGLSGGAYLIVVMKGVVV